MARRAWLGRIDGRGHCLVFTLTFRVVSFRRAHEMEIMPSAPPPPGDRRVDRRRFCAGTGNRGAPAERRDSTATAGPPESVKGQQVTLRLPGAVIEHFKAAGPGWQTRAVAVLEREAKRG